MYVAHVRYCARRYCYSYLNVSRVTKHAMTGFPALGSQRSVTSTRVLKGRERTCRTLSSMHVFYAAARQLLPRTTSCFGGSRSLVARVPLVTGLTLRSFVITQVKVILRDGLGKCRPPGNHRDECGQDAAHGEHVVVRPLPA